MKNYEIDPLYSQLAESVLKNGKNGASPRGQSVRELYNVGFCLKNARNSVIRSPLRKMNYAYAVIEMLGLMRTGELNIEPYCWYNSVMSRFLNPQTKKWDGSYADRLSLYRQLPEMHKILKADPDSRRAVMSFYNPAHDFHDYNSLDVCCTLNLAFRLRENKLHLTGIMRSNDILLGLPYDLTQFTFLQSVLAAWLGVETGEYYHFTANLHAYEQDWERLHDICSMPWGKEGGGFVMPAWDIAGIEQTYEEIELFFAAEKRLRAGLDAQFKGTSRALKYFLATIIQPYVLRKLKKN